MSWFFYGKPTRRVHRKGVWLRVSRLPDSILGEAQKALRPDEMIMMCKVEELRPNGKVLLELKAVGLGDVQLNRCNCFYILVDEDPEWVCEGDLGRGFKD